MSLRRVSLCILALIVSTGAVRSLISQTTGSQSQRDAGHPSEAQLKGENLLFAPPRNFEKAYHSDRIGSLTEFVPRGETVDDWTEMITVQVFHGLKSDPAPFLQTIGRLLAKSCPGFSTPKGIITGKENGYVVSMLIVKCPINPATGKPETTLYRIIKGKDALYSVQHAWRAVASDNDLGDAVLAFGKVTVCDTDDASHPCPSFDSLAPGPQSKPRP
ncbi:hypothetical protein SAMN05421819_4385 [Bryocella elongata]|uniref:Uncharacterized protein n=1 Tax=Bryocella elongata TaxID=863522 RepID=A0A1H6CA46_9BACT|nr:hypothetical protein [Bryocella elongata]SEG69841.1 hypothetical protein SAMN05421819_4385 [Bryocella elongata]